jgi:hypothetical protein
MTKLFYSLFLALFFLSAVPVSTAHARDYQNAKQYISKTKKHVKNKRKDKLSYEQRKTKIIARYEKVIKKINSKQKAPKKLKSLLLTHAKERKNLALKNLQRSHKLFEQHKKERKALIEELKSQRKSAIESSNDQFGEDFDL